jgi:mannose-6-phosphate isomerase-like protein (cupin superfamily)
MIPIHKKAASLPFFVASDGCLLAEVIHPTNDGTRADLSVARASLPPGQSTRPHLLEFVEIYYVVSGQGIMHLGEEQVPVEADSCIYLPPHTVQWLQNTSQDQDIVFLCICQPAYDAAKDRPVLEGSAPA